MTTNADYAEYLDFDDDLLTELMRDYNPTLIGRGPFTAAQHLAIGELMRTRQMRRTDRLPTAGPIGWCGMTEAALTKLYGPRPGSIYSVCATATTLTTGRAEQWAARCLDMGTDLESAATRAADILGRFVSDQLAALAYRIKSSHGSASAFTEEVESALRFTLMGAAIPKAAKAAQLLLVPYQDTFSISPYDVPFAQLRAM